MSLEHEQKVQGVDLSGIIVAAALIVLGIVALWDTTNMADADSFVVPRMVAISMMAFCILFIVLQMIAPSIGTNEEAGMTGGSSPRRIGLVIAMVLAALLMPWLGFLLSGALAFAAIMLLAMYDEWTPFRRLVFPVVGIVIVAGFYVIFAELLLVPLPVGSLFG